MRPHNNNFRNGQKRFGGKHFDRNNRRPERPKENGLMVYVEDNNIEKAIRKLRRKIDKSGLMRDLREKQYYSKPSEQRKEAKKQAIKRWKKQQKIQDDLR